MEKDLMKKRFGLPPMPNLGSGPPGKRNMIRKKDYSPVYWDKYFDFKKDVTTCTGDTFRVYEKGTEGPVLFFLHGGGFSALSWALLSSHVTSLVKCRCVAVDLRGHGDSVTADDTNLSAEQMSSDVGNIISALYQDDPPPIILVGHSMGGAIAVHTAVRRLVTTLIGIAVIDVVEGTALEALASMQSFLRGRPKTFESMDKAIEWAVRSGQILNLESARVSMVGQLKSASSDETGPEELEHQHVSYTDTIEEEEHGEGAETSVANHFRKPAVPQSNHKYTWRIDLSRTEKFWQGWFEGLSQKFLSCEPPKMLILAGPDRLDKDLTIGQMQACPCSAFYGLRESAFPAAVLRRRSFEAVGGLACERGGLPSEAQSALSHVTSLVKCRCVAVDLRGHGDSVTADDTDLSAEQMSSDVGNIISALYQDDPPPIILVGHSMGGAIAVHTAVRRLVTTLIGIAVIDVVEDLKHLSHWIKQQSVAVRSGQILNLESARVSMVGQLKSASSDETGPEELEHQHVSYTDTIEEEEHGEGAETSAANHFRKPSVPQSNHKYTWRIDLSRTEKFWQGWFEGLSQKFLSCEPPKMLILAGPDRLDKDLTIGQMQGKFQMNLLPQCGHAVHEDVPDRVADVLANFMIRHRVTEAIGNFERSVPGC
ncbi:Protein phosphatase methylesterase 1 [Bulinus truncatus]|nr:Protein phosphatase methylesterase 1 [Bulinus truncatus]